MATDEELLVRMPWLDPDDHEAHRRMAAEKVGNYIGCAEGCQTPFSMYPELLAQRAEVQRLTDLVTAVRGEVQKGYTFRSDDFDDGLEWGRARVRDILGQSSESVTPCPTGHNDHWGNPWGAVTDYRIAVLVCPNCSAPLAKEANE